MRRVGGGRGDGGGLAEGGGGALLSPQVAEGAFAARQPLLACRALDVVAHQARGDGADADERVLEVTAHLSRRLSVAALQLAAEAFGGVAVTAHGAVLTVVLVRGGRRLAGASRRGVGAQQAGLAVVVPPAQFSLLQPVREQAWPHQAVHVDAHGAGAAVLVGRAALAVAGLLLRGRRLLQLLQRLRRTRRVPIEQGRGSVAGVAAVAQVAQHLWAEAVEEPSPGARRRGQQRSGRQQQKRRWHSAANSHLQPEDFGLGLRHSAPSFLEPPPARMIDSQQFLTP